MGQNNNMADTKGGFFSTKVQKHASRAKEKILQNLGKADKTTDELFNEYEINFTRQQNNSARLHKEVANYLRCARALHGASKALFETLMEVYEPEWVGHDLLYVQAQNSDMLWTDFCHKLQDQTFAPLTCYTQQFPELRKKIDKRGRKLVDYDSQRHQLENLDRSARRDEYKIARARDQLELARTTYEQLNKELYDEIPTVYDQRIPHTAEALQTLFAAESTFMQESSKIDQELEAIGDKLTKENAKGTYKTKRGSPRPISVHSPTSPISPGQPAMWYAGSGERPIPEEDRGAEGYETKPIDDGFTASLDLPSEEPIDLQEISKDNKTNNFCEVDVRNNDSYPLPIYPDIRDDNTDNRPAISGPVSSPKEEIGRPYEEIEFEDKKVNGTTLYRANGEIIGTKVPAEGATMSVRTQQDSGLSSTIQTTGATTDGLPSGVLYRVRATYKYTQEDVDELAFEVGDIIDVVEYDDPEEQEEGWLCGIKQSNQEKGLFPANFTRPI